MNIINPAIQIYFNGNHECWLEYSSGHIGIRVPTKLGEIISGNIGHAVNSEQIIALVGTDNTISREDSSRLLSALFVHDSTYFKSGYHLATENHPFLDMSKGLSALEKDASVMSEYVKNDDYPDVELRVESLQDIPLVDAINLDVHELRNSVFYQFSMILSGTFGARLHQPSYYDAECDYHQVELLKKSIPSGGARHPTECFVEIHRSPDIDKGVYYFSPTKSTLKLISKNLPSSIEAQCVEDTNADWVVRLVLCSAVRRSMFRYRDSRSFRALLVDAGHAESQLAALSNYCNWHYKSRFVVDFEYAKRYTNESSNDCLPAFSIGLLEGWT